ncbi:unnamed protein product [Penicillium viridicatum]
MTGDPMIQGTTLRVPRNAENSLNIHKMSRTQSPQKKHVQSVTQEYPWRSDNPFGPPEVPPPVPSGIKRLRNTLSKLSPSAFAEKELLRKKNQCKSPLTQRNVHTLVTEQECNEAYKPNLHSPQIQVNEWLQRVS